MPKKKKQSKKSIRDLLLFFSLTGFFSASFLIQDYPDAMFFSILLVLFLVLLVWLRQYHKEHQFSGLVDYDENMDVTGLGWVAIGAFSTYVVASLIVSNLTISSIYVPFQGLSTVNFGAFQLEGFWNDILFNLSSVAPAEELVKLVLHLALFIKFKPLFSEFVARALSVGLPVGGWTMLHAYSAYTGPNMTTLLLSAFVGGLIIFAVMWKTCSLLGAILTHAGYNIIIIYLVATQGGTSMSLFMLCPSSMLLLIAVNLFVLLMASVYGRLRYGSKKEAR